MRQVIRLKSQFLGQNLVRIFTVEFHHLTGGPDVPGEYSTSQSTWKEPDVQASYSNAECFRTKNIFLSDTLERV